MWWKKRHKTITNLEKFSIDVYFSNKPKDKEEDAKPIIKIINEDYVVLGVFDGLGGAGAKKYFTEDGEYTGAFIGSRVIRKSIDDFVTSEQIEVLFTDTESFLSELKTEMKSSLTREYENLISYNENNKTRIRGTIVKTLPTTMALMVSKTTDNQKCEVASIWAGDSRNFALTPEKGLQQLTKDDLIKDQDAYENIRFDSPMSNVICLENDFVLNFSSNFFEPPVALISATDGAFAYFPTPTYFEFIVLSALQDSNSIEDWKCKIADRIKKYSEDDTSITIMLIGFKNHQELRSIFRNRTQHLTSGIKKIEEIKKKIGLKEKEINALRSTFEKLKIEDWENYKQLYNDLIPNVK